MATKTQSPLLAVAAIAAGLLLLPVAIFVVGLDLLPLMALTAWSGTVWIASVIVLLVFAVVGAIMIVLGSRAKRRV